MPATKKRSKVFKDEKQIAKLIDRRHVKISENIRRMEQLRRDIQECVSLLQSGNKHRAADARNDLDAYRKMFERIDKQTARMLTQLPRLKEALSASRTCTMEFMGEYKGVAV